MLGIIGGTGLYQIDGLEIIKAHIINTPFGEPSAAVTEGKLAGSDQKIFFLPRHGSGHGLLPSEVNYRANIWALKSLGVRRVLSVSATGSLREHIKPANITLISQYFDHTRGGKRDYSFFGRGVVGHVSTARPSCPSLTHDLINAAQKAGIDLHKEATYACVEGPRLGTRAESLFLREAGCDVVGMTNVPEAFLAREAQMAYVTVAIATDYDCWMDDPEQHAEASDIVALYMANIEKIKRLIQSLAETAPSPTPDWITGALKHAVITPPDNISPDNKAWLDVLKR